MAKSAREKFDREGFFASLRKKAFSPVYYFYGEEDFLIEECIDAVIEAALDPSMKEFNLDILQGSETEAKKVVSIASVYPMMAERRIVVVKEFERIVTKDSEEIMERYFDRPSSTTILILAATSMDFRKKMYLSLKKNGIGGECRPLWDNETLAWIESRFKKIKRSADPKAAALLHAYVGNSLRELSNEIEKLTISAGDRMMITEEDVERIVGVSKEFTPFELANKIGEKNMKRSLEIADRLVNSGESAVPIIAALTSHFIKLWKIHEGVRQKKSDQDLAHIAGLHPYFVKAYAAQAQNYSLAELENAFLILADADLSVKSSADPKLVLTRALTEIIKAVHSSQITSAV